MFRYIYIWILFFIFTTTHAFANENHIKVAVNKNLAPYTFIDQQDKNSGFFIDYLNLILKEQAYKIEYIEPNKKQLLEEEFDIYLGFQNQKYLENKVENLTPLYPSQQRVYVLKENKKKITKIQDLKGKTLGFEKKLNIKEHLEKNYQDIKFKEYENYQSLYEALLNKSIDAFVQDKVLVWYEQVKDFDFSRVEQVDDFIFNDWLYLLVNKKRVKLATSLANQISNVSKKDILDLEEKWIVNKNLFYFNKIKKSIFTQEELNYIKKKKKVKIGVDKWAPVYFVQKDGSIGGISGDFLDKISELSGLEFDVISNSWVNNLQDFKDKKIDMLPGVFYSKKREIFGKFSQPYLTVRNSIFFKDKEDLSINSFKDLEGKKLVVVKGGFLSKELKKKFPKINLVEVKNTKQCLDYLLEDKADALLASDLVLYDLLKKNLIVGVKSVLQNDIPANKAHFFTRIDEPILNSIIEKSLDSIANTQKVKILAKWVTPTKIKKSINVAFSYGKEPYNIDKKYLKGIEYDLVEKILNASGISISNQMNYSILDLHRLLDNEPKIDMVVGVQEDKNTSYFYSDILLNFQNIVVTRKKENINISSIEDLKGKKVGAFAGAFNYLGSRYKELFSPEKKDKNYKEYDDQDRQVKDFLDGLVDVIVLDKNIFRWYLNKYKKNSLHSFRFDYVFPGLTGIRVAFRDENIRNIFNKNLKVLKRSGYYESIFNDYFQGIIIEKVKIKSLISSLVARNIFTDEVEELDEIVKILSSLPYIKKIEVFNNNDELLSASSTVKLNRFDLQDSYHFILNAPQKVGYVKIYFNVDATRQVGEETYYIPSLKAFEKLRSFPYVKEVYKKFNYIDSKVRFTIEEQAFIKNNPVIKFSEINWKPLGIIDENSRFSGLMNDYIKIIEEVSGLKFEFTPEDKFIDVLDDFVKGKIDFTPIIGGYEVRREFGNLSDPYMTFSYAVVSNKEATFINDFNALNFKKIALPVGHTSNLYLEKNYPNIEVVKTKNIEEALNLVSSGEVFATIEAMPVSIFYIKNYYPDLKIVGLSEDKFTLNFLVQRHKPELLSIMNKVLASITYEQREKIQDKWVKVEVSTAMDYSILYKTIGVFLVIMTIFMFFYSKLSKAKHELMLKSKDLKEQKEIFETLFSDTTDSIALLKNGRFIDCNPAALKLLKFKTKDQFLNLHPYEISPLNQPDGTPSAVKEKEKIDECLKNGSAKFEWVHKKANGEEIWVDVLLTKILIHKEEVLHVVWRDITDKKSLEKQIIRRNEELEESNHELEMSLENLQKTQNQLVTSEKMASLGGLVAGVAHEVNTPVGIGLTGITHLLEMSKILKEKYNNEKMSQEDFEEYLKTAEELSILINSNLERAADLVKSFKKVAVDQTSEVKREFDLEEYIKEVLSSIYNITKKTKIKIDIISHDEIVINSYPGAISQIVTNLIMNSLIHAYEKDQVGSIKIELIQKSDLIKIVYSDDGRGISKEHLPKIFDPFFTTNREKGGSGLGLNIIYNIVTTTLGGKISCKSEVGQGVEFNIEFKSS